MSTWGVLGWLEVEHRPLSREDIPEALLQDLEERRFQYVWFYRTDLTNKTDRPVRVVWFDGFCQWEGRWFASNTRDRVLRTNDFLDWYGGDDMTPDGWLRSGGTASCRVNWHWSSEPEDQLVKWAYVAVDAEGNDYFAEGIVGDIPPVKIA